MTLASPRSSSVSWVGSATWRDMSKPAGVAQRRLLLEVPPRPAGLDGGRGVGVDHLGGRDHGVGQGLARHRDAVLDLGAHDASHAHGVERTGGPGLRGVAWAGGRRRVVPRCADRTAVHAAGHGDCGAQVCAGLTGRVLEIGFGSGLNLAAYPAAVTSVDAVEPSDLAWRLSEDRRAVSAVPVERVGLDGQRLAAADASYDAVVSTFTLCTIPDVGAALRGAPPGATAGRRRARTGARARAGRRVARVAAPPRRVAGPVRRRLPPGPGRARRCWARPGLEVGGSSRLPARAGAGRSRGATSPWSRRCGA